MKVSERSLDSLVKKGIIFVFIWNLIIKVVERLIVSGSFSVTRFELLIEHVIVALWHIDVQTVV